MQEPAAAVSAGAKEVEGSGSGQQAEMEAMLAYGRNAFLRAQTQIYRCLRRIIQALEQDEISRGTGSNSVAYHVKLRTGSCRSDEALGRRRRAGQSRVCVQYS